VGRVEGEVANARGAHWPRRRPTYCLKANFPSFTRCFHLFQEERRNFQGKHEVLRRVWLECVGHTLKGDVESVGGVHLIKEGPTTHFE
jgi:hypothetical protein